MKARLAENSLNLRLSEADVQTLGSRGEVSLALSLSPGYELRFRLVTKSRVDDVQISISGSTITTILPESWIGDWQNDDRIGFESVVLIDDGQKLRVHVEKDLRWFKKKSAAD